MFLSRPLRVALVVVALTLAACSGGGSSLNALAPDQQRETASHDPLIPDVLNGATIKTLYAFYNAPSGGGNPYAGLLYANGVFYGTTAGFGAPYDASSPNPECGSVYSMTPDVTFTTFTTKFLHRFLRTDGCEPLGSLILVGSRLYGTTYGGGSSQNGGTVFSISTTGGAVTDLYSFQCGTDGCRPEGPLVNVGSNLCGTTSAGGGGCGEDGGCGTVYSVPLTGGSDTILHTFSGARDGTSPTGGLVNVGANLYGTTATGGTSNNGTVFGEPLTGGAEVMLYSFAGGRTDGANPNSYGSLVSVDSNLYGTTRAGGPSGNGSVFSLPLTGGPDAIVHFFSGGPDGAAPEASLLLVGATFYGTTNRAGTHDDGTLFRLPLSGGSDTRLHQFKIADGALNAGRNSALIEVNNALYGATQVSGRARGLGYGTTFQLTLPQQSGSTITNRM